MICGCAAFATGCFPLGFVAVYLGMKARRLAKEQPDRYGGDGLALAGMIVGGIVGVLYTVLILVYVVFFVGIFAFTAASGAGP